ncbi:hypothetical protein OUZ56_010714 [Daphnia magna]|uniref:Uncharacterized protein n=1 Tax=Daphnia magna TaxID=35525 RepID=A0ABQ9YYE6_9CRUS|nr:hypothetical protein OUZ56_010714 [Daphnia magna]
MVRGSPLNGVGFIPSGPVVTDAPRCERLDAGSVRLPSATDHLGPTSGLVCCELESTAGALRQLAAPTGGNGRGCFQPELEPLGIFLPPIFLDSALPEQDKEGSGRDGSDSPDLASATLVPSSDESGVRAPSDFTNIQRDPVGSVGMSASASIQSDVVTSRLEIIRERYEAQGLSKGVVELLLGADRDTTAAAYQSAWNGWRTWCFRQSEDPLSPGLNKRTRRILRERRSPWFIGFIAFLSGI